MYKLLLVFSLSLFLGASSASAFSGNNTHAKHHKAKTGVTCASAKCMNAGTCTDPKCMKNGKCTMGMHSKSKTSKTKSSKSMSALAGTGTCTKGCAHSGCMGMAKKN